MRLFSWLGRRRSPDSPRTEAAVAPAAGPVFVSSRGQVFYPQPRASATTEVPVAAEAAPDVVEAPVLETPVVEAPVLETPVVDEPAEASPLVDLPFLPSAPPLSAAPLEAPALPDPALPDPALLAELEAMATPEQRTGEEVAGRVAIGFRDGSTVAVAPESPQGRALRAVADTLVSGELDEAS
jgi:hypothetical protein